MLVREAIGRFLGAQGVRVAFGVVGSGNFHITNALVAAGARFVAARHEGGAVCMADGYARMSGEVGVLTVHQGPGFTNTMTGLAEAAKSATPLLVLAPEATDERSNFFVDQAAMATAVGAVAARVRSPRTALVAVANAYATARNLRRTVVLNIPIDVQDLELPDGPVPVVPAPEPPPTPATRDVARLADLLLGARRPVLIAGRGSRSVAAAGALSSLGARTGALLATSAVARGLFHGEPWNLDVSGGFASPLAAELIGHADLIVGWGCALNMWTMRHGKLIGPGATVVQVDADPARLGRARPVDLGIWGGVTETAEAVLDILDDHFDSRGWDRADAGYQTPRIAARIAAELRWDQVPYDDESTASRIDPRTLSIELNRLLPAERVVSIDSGNFMGWPSMYLDVPDENGFCFTQAFQSIGLGLATGIGAAIAQPDRLPVVGTGDGGFLMGISELDTAVRLKLPLVVIVYNDAAYGAEVHHFTGGESLANVTFPDTDIAAIARGHGCTGITVRSVGDLDVVRGWLATRGGPLVIDAKITPMASWWLQEAFGH
ncbi:thiamine pyrophosphate-binding protein [Frankia sp. CNm7]|uniref:Thiamine pyrophosphate-binding protein n=1 Tax=Frankia nepalensis TaxID=1836974 RepID=A0A937ULE5_9ACTN|nr:thiamine pyrophosphate-binding protein [Frankia nepalensis]MBL7499594.1 thiamine pyrophosphate-binding protein [Frankia nepalensis]MBL7514220.1 thiamine pyrophosphate-binding protein [Frankia nepalensis]MBL7524720.1 thiamine pyrophosphate-binding protein [Frankia nepalensis]MBL7625712.1 thiamine pyrophosphate-binding protein [Frankia nepalensis]